MKIELKNTETSKAAAVNAPDDVDHASAARSRLRSIGVVIGRVFFSLIFIAAGLNHFSAHSIELAAAHGVPFSTVAVPLSGALSLAGGLSILLGFRAKAGAWLIVLFLIPTTLMMHKFWGIADPAAAEIQMIMFMKNISILGGALIISHFGAGPFSIDARQSQKSHHPSCKRGFNE